MPSLGGRLVGSLRASVLARGRLRHMLARSEAGVRQRLLRIIVLVRVLAVWRGIILTLRVVQLLVIANDLAQLLKLEMTSALHEQPVRRVRTTGESNTHINLLQ